MSKRRHLDEQLRRIRDYPPELMQCADPDLSAKGVAHAVLHGVLDGVPECASCGAWPIVGEHVGCRGPLWSSFWSALKAKGITDHKDHHGGHRSDRMRDVYVRQPDRIEPTA